MCSPSKQQEKTKSSKKIKKKQQQQQDQRRESTRKRERSLKGKEHDEYTKRTEEDHLDEEMVSSDNEGMECSPHCTTFTTPIVDKNHIGRRKSENLRLELEEAAALSGMPITTPVIEEDAVFEEDASPDKEAQSSVVISAEDSIERDFGLQTMNLICDMYTGNGVRQFVGDVFDCLHRNYEDTVPKEDQHKPSELPLKFRNEQLYSINTSLHEQLATHKQLLLAANSRIDALENQQLDLIEERCEEKMAAERQQLLDVTNNYRNEVVRLKGKIVVFEEEKVKFVEMKEQLDRSTRENEEGKSEISKLKEQLEKRRKEIEVMKKNRTEIDEESRKTRCETERVAAMLVSNQNELKGRENDILKLKEALKERDAERKHLLEINEDECARIREYEKRMDDATKECGRLRTDNVKLKNEQKMIRANSSQAENSSSKAAGSDLVEMAATLNSLTDSISVLNDRLTQQEQKQYQLQMSPQQQQQLQMLVQDLIQESQQSGHEIRERGRSTAAGQQFQATNPIGEHSRSTSTTEQQQLQQQGDIDAVREKSRSTSTAEHLQSQHHVYSPAPASMPPPHTTGPVKLVPGPRQYSEVVDKGQETLIFSTSITRGIKKKEINDMYVGEGEITLYRYSGGLARHIKEYLKVPLNDATPESVIIQTGGNDLPTPRSNPVPVADIAMDIIKSGLICKDHGVKNICIGSVLMRRPYYTEARCRDLNKILEEECKNHGFVFINHYNIDKTHLLNDGVHLTYEGSNLLRNNYLFNLNSFKWGSMC